MSVTVEAPDQEHVASWREYIRALVRVDPDANPERLVAATRELATEAARSYPAFEADEKIALSGDMLGTSVIPMRLSVDMLTELLKRTGAVLLAGVDGPLATASEMVEEIEKIGSEEQAQWRARMHEIKGGDDARG